MLSVGHQGGGDHLRELRVLGNNPLQGIGEAGNHRLRLWRSALQGIGEAGNNRLQD